MTQLIRTVPSALRTLFTSGMQLVTADLYTIVLSDGTTTIRWAAFDQIVTVGSTSWVLGPGISSTRLKMIAGVETDTLNVTFISDDSNPCLVNGVPLNVFLNRGGLDGAQVTVDRAYAAAPGTAWVGTLQRFYGRVSDIDRVSRVETDVTLRSFTEVFNSAVPRNVYQAACLNTLYDSSCNVSQAGLGVAGTVTTASSSLNLSFTASGLTAADGYFSLGMIVFNTGANAGTKRSVRVHAAGGVVTLMQPAAGPIAVGDTFTIYPGCDKTLTTCVTKFNNRARFRGEPWVPVPESVL